MAYTFADFKEHINKKVFADRNRHYKRLIEVLESYIDVNEVKHFYPVNLVNGNEKKEFIFFTEKHFIFVSFQKEEKYFVNCVPIPKGEILLEIPEYNHLGVTLTFKHENEELITLNSLNDSNKDWNDEYIENIVDIYKFLLAM